MAPSTRKGDRRTEQSLRVSGNWCRATYPTALATVAVPLGKNAPLMEQNCPVSSSAKVNFPALRLTIGFPELDWIAYLRFSGLNSCWVTDTATS